MKQKWCFEYTDNRRTIIYSKPFYSSHLSRKDLLDVHIGVLATIQAELLIVNQCIHDPRIKIVHFASHFHYFANCFICHLSQPPQRLLDCWQAHHIKVMKDLCVNLSFLQHRLRNFTVLAGIAFNKVNHIGQTTYFQSILLLLIATIHNRRR